jgi:threonine/homoserine/homoserine lactone efflux protein
MIQTLMVGALISVMWVGIGVAMIALPAWWQDRMRRTLADPLGILLMAQGMILGGLLLFLGTSALRGAWLWMVLGALTAVKGLLLLSIAAPLRDRWMERWGRSPAWVHRLAGVLLLALGTLLAVDIVQGTL